MKWSNPTKTEIMNAVKTSKTFWEARQKLKIQTSKLKILIDKLKLDTSHFCRKPQFNYESLSNNDIYNIVELYLEKYVSKLDIAKQLKLPLNVIRKILKKENASSNLTKIKNLKNSEICLTNIESYLLGLLQTDGSRQSKTNIYIELSIKDIDILYKIKSYFTNTSRLITRTRNTNFRKNYTSSILNIWDPTFLSKIDRFIPIGKKSNIIMAPQNIQYSTNDYWRGVIDGDGSLGFRKDGTPFLSLNTSSDQLYYDFNKFIKKYLNFTTNVNRNKRDNTYNVCLNCKKAYIIIKLLYFKNIISIERKQKISNKIINS